MTISRLILLKIKNVLDKICRENQNTRFMLNNFLPKIAHFMICLKYGGGRKAANDNMTARYMLDK